MFKLQFRQNGRLVTFRDLTEEQARAGVAFARTLGDASVVELRVQTPAVDRFGPVWADVTDQF
ncbi:hypothetical protein HOU95_gp056 [Streptomyces phage Hiyaa]|uniref:Uncharacterized protein n=1 Tax=Streptomyces phage Hiyaa TaxID=2499072 RepID=A0A3S9U8U5_9CAUD|nr:hypothetical protein HOU95_gp056 [Streptomyces phage Hiyaa]AZS06751.1 hypothetical protein SEA_HIYAA_112 [Streptomyces phage Hiyaa]